MEKCILDNHKDPKKKKFKDIDEKTQKYIFEGWEAQGENVEWLKAHESRLICVLSVSLFKVIGNKTSFNRMEILQQCVKGWVDNGQYVLIFIPVKNLPEYKDCFIKMNRDFKNTVRIAAYNVNPFTCGKNMVVGESRNAILDFVRKYKEIFTSCVVSDERIYNATFGINYVGELKDEIGSEKVDAFRRKYGYKVFNIVRDFITEKPSEREKLRTKFQELSDEFDKDVRRLKIKKKYLNKAPICRPKNLRKGMKILAQFAEGEYKGTLAKKKSGGWWEINWDDGTSSDYFEENIRPQGMKPNLFDSLRDRNSLTLLGFSSARRYPFHADYSEQHLKAGERRKTEIIAQITMFRVNRKKDYEEDDSDYGWHGQQDYTKTTMCEDNVWSYDWAESKSLGEVGELDSLLFQRKKGISLTRTTKKVNQMSKCALEELVEACMSNSYQVGKRTVRMKWTPFHSGVSLGAEKLTREGPSPYYFMACLLRDLYGACIKNRIKWKTDDIGAAASEEKVKRISQILNSSKTLKL